MQSRISAPSDATSLNFYFLSVGAVAGAGLLSAFDSELASTLLSPLLPLELLGFGPPDLWA